ncbi:MAG: type IV pilin protein [Gammaproteobacteria bacterium]
MVAQKGMSLIELIVVMLVIAILGIVGVPSYRGYMERAQRTEAKDALLRLANNQERFYLQNNTYTTDVTSLGFAAGGYTDDGSYSVSVTAADRQGFTARASVVSGGGMAGDSQCSWFEIDEAGEKTAADAECW